MQGMPQQGKQRQVAEVPAAKATRTRVAVALACITLAGCASFGESNNHNVNPASADVKLLWTRIDTPSAYPTIMHACDGTTGLYVVHDGTNIAVVINDRLCGGKYSE